MTWIIAVAATFREQVKTIMLKILIFPLILGVFFFGYLDKVFASDDWQYWNEVKFKYSIHKKLDFHVKMEQRYVDDFDDFALHNYAPGIVYKVNPQFNFELNYKYEKEKRKGDWTDEHRMEIISIIKWKWSGFHLMVRNRIEYRSIEGDNRWRLREKLKIKKPYEIIGLRFVPFISEEIFYDFKDDEFNQNRFKAGITKEITKHLEIDLYSMYKSNRSNGDWFGVNVLGTEFIFHF
jgi:hypothetical protein